MKLRWALLPCHLTAIVACLLVPCYMVRDRGYAPRYAADSGAGGALTGHEVVIVEGHDGLQLEMIRSVGFESAVEGSTSIVFLHGFPDNFRSFDHQLAHFRALGYHTASLAMRGYAPQSIPTDDDMSLVAVARDVISVLSGMNASESSSERPRRFHLVGHDWGSAVAQVAVRLSGAALFESLTVAAVPDLKRMNLGMAMKNPAQLVNSWYIFFFQFPILPELWIGRGNAVIWLWSSWGSAPYSKVRLESVLATFDEDARVPRAALGMYRQNMLPILMGPAVGRFMGRRARELWDALDEPMPVPALAVVGESDQCMLASTFRETMGDWIADGGTVEVVPGGHFLHSEPGNEGVIIEPMLRLFRKTSRVV